jgi:FixJ family two-component response regulator
MTATLRCVVTKGAPLIAIVDDEESVCRALQRLMLSVGLEVEAFTSGAAFLESLKTHSPDCVVLDLHMPEMSGFDVQARLAQSGKKLPIVTITGHDTPESQQRVMEAGASAYLRKPMNDKALLDAVLAAVASNPDP